MPWAVEKWPWGPICSTNLQTDYSTPMLTRSCLDNANISRESAWTVRRETHRWYHKVVPVYSCIKQLRAVQMIQFFAEVVARLTRIVEVQTLLSCRVCTWHSKSQSAIGDTGQRAPVSITHLQWLSACIYIRCWRMYVLRYLTVSFDLTFHAYCWGRTYNMCDQWLTRARMGWISWRLEWRRAPNFCIHICNVSGWRNLWTHFPLHCYMYTDRTTPSVRRCPAVYKCSLVSEELNIASPRWLIQSTTKHCPEVYFV